MSYNPLVIYLRTASVYLRVVRTRADLFCILKTGPNIFMYIALRLCKKNPTLGTAKAFRHADLVPISSVWPQL